MAGDDGAAKTLAVSRSCRAAPQHCHQKLARHLPKNTYVGITASHGKLFGREGYFGHDPIALDKGFEAPPVEGKVR